MAIHQKGFRLWALCLPAVLLGALWTPVGALADRTPIQERRSQEIGPSYATGAGRWALHLGVDGLPFFEFQVAAANNLTLGLQLGAPDGGGVLYQVSFNYYSFEPYAGFYAGLRFGLIDFADGTTSASLPVSLKLDPFTNATSGSMIIISGMVGWSWHATRHPFSTIVGLGPIYAPKQGSMASDDLGFLIRISLAVDFWLSDVFF